MTVTWISRPVVYKDCVISVKKLADDKYVFTVRKAIELDLSGVTSNLPAAFEKAREMIDKLEDAKDE